METFVYFKFLSRKYLGIDLIFWYSPIYHCEFMTPPPLYKILSHPCAPLHLNPPLFTHHLWFPVTVSLGAIRIRHHGPQYHNQDSYKAIKHFNCTQHVFKFKASSNILACHLRKQFCLAKSCIRKLIPLGLFSICHSDDQWLNRHIVTDLLN